MIIKAYIYLRVKWIIFTASYTSRGYIEACTFYRSFTGEGLKETVEAVKRIRG